MVERFDAPPPAHRCRSTDLQRFAQLDFCESVKICAICGSKKMARVPKPRGAAVRGTGGRRNLGPLSSLASNAIAEQEQRLAVRCIERPPLVHSGRLGSRVPG